MLHKRPDNFVPLGSYKDTRTCLCCVHYAAHQGGRFCGARGQLVERHAGRTCADYTVSRVGVGYLGDRQIGTVRAARRVG